VRRRLILIGLLVALVSLVAAGCGGDDDEASGTTETPTEPAPAEEEPAPAEEEPAAPEEEPAEEEPAPAEEETAAPEADLQDSLVILEPDIAPALDPDSSNAAAPELQEMHVNMFEPLIDYPIVDNGEGVLEPQYQVTPDGYEPRLAESWTSTINDDGTVTWTFTLRSGVTSCAGNTLTADDVIYSWQRAKSVSGGSPVTWFLGNVSAILGLEVFEEDEALKELNETEVRKVDDLTVEFTQVNENDLFPRVQAITFQGIFDSTVMLEQATDDDPWAHNYTDTENIPAYGAYCLSNWTKGTEITLTANPNYYRDQPQFQTITIRKVPQ
jgi:peptide/nickel transport system substrate-binding protein